MNQADVQTLRGQCGGFVLAQSFLFLVSCQDLVENKHW
jgi:hypothetical protein